jgi:hypothetical protein
MVLLCTTLQRLSKLRARRTDFTCGTRPVVGLPGAPLKVLLHVVSSLGLFGERVDQIVGDRLDACRLPVSLWSPSSISWELLPILRPDLHRMDHKLRPVLARGK